jgi:hypothetical protein
MIGTLLIVGGFAAIIVFWSPGTSAVNAPTQPRTEPSAPVLIPPAGGDASEAGAQPSAPVEPEPAIDVEADAAEPEAAADEIEELSDHDDEVDHEAGDEEEAEDEAEDEAARLLHNGGVAA